MGNGESSIDANTLKNLKPLESVIKKAKKKLLALLRFFAV